MVRPLDKETIFIPICPRRTSGRSSRERILEVRSNIVCAGGVATGIGVGVDVGVGVGEIRGVVCPFTAAGEAVIKISKLRNVGKAKARKLFIGLFYAKELVPRSDRPSQAYFA